MSLTKEQIDELRELYKRTTQGEWQRDLNNFSQVVVLRKRGEVSVSDTLVVQDLHATQDDLKFIAAAHNAMPALLGMLAERDAGCGCGHHKHRSDAETGAARECLECECRQFYNVHMLVESLRAELQRARQSSENERTRLAEFIIGKGEENESPNRKTTAGKRAGGGVGITVPRKAGSQQGAKTMSNPNQERRGCRVCGKVDLHSVGCSLNNTYGCRTPVRDSQRSPERHGLRYALYASRCEGGEPQQFARVELLHQEDDQMIEEIVENFNGYNFRDCLISWARADDSPQPPLEAALCGAHCGHDPRWMMKGVCMHFEVGTGKWQPTCGHRCFPAPETPRRKTMKHTEIAINGVSHDVVSSNGEVIAVTPNVFDEAETRAPSALTREGEAVWNAAIRAARSAFDQQPGDSQAYHDNTMVNAGAMERRVVAALETAHATTPLSPAPDKGEVSGDAIAQRIIDEFQGCMLVPDGYTHESFYKRRLASIIEAELG